MLARVSGGDSGVIEYLEQGIKNGREQSRDELDLRHPIDGNIALTQCMIKQMADENQKNNYLHITLSFAEKDITSEKMQAAYSEYKETVLAAYSEDEVNVYAEIHYPKVKSYTDKRTGETIQRHPHIHMVIPTKNLASGKALAPFGRYKDNIDYHDAIQEHVNRKFELDSPYDHQRDYRISGRDEFISRYKGDDFKGNNRKLKQELADRIMSGEIRTSEKLHSALADIGEVRYDKQSDGSTHLSVKPFGEARFSRFKEPIFSPAMLDGQQLRQKPSQEVVEATVHEWRTCRSLEVKYIHPSSAKKRGAYRDLDEDAKLAALSQQHSENLTHYNLSPRGQDDPTTNATISFKGANHKLKKAIVFGLKNEAVTSERDYVTFLKKFGDVKLAKAGTDDRYYKVKPQGTNRFVRLKEDVFKPTQFTKLTHRDNASASKQKLHAQALTLSQVMTVKPDTLSHSTDTTEKVINEPERNPTDDIISQHIRAHRQAHGHKPRFKPTKFRKPQSFANVSRGLPSLSERTLDGSRKAERPQYTSSERRNQRAGVLFDHARHNLVKRGERNPNPELRRNVPDRRLTSEIVFNYRKAQESAQCQTLREITLKRVIDPERVLSRLKTTHGLYGHEYEAKRTKFGAKISKNGALIPVERFLQTEINMTAKEAKQYLKETYREQRNDQDAHFALNQLAFVSNHGRNHNNPRATLAIFSRLQAKERYNMRYETMSDKNEKNFLEEEHEQDDVTMTHIHEQLQKQRQLMQNLTMRMPDVMAVPDKKDSTKIDFHHKDSADKKPLFRDEGEKISFDRNADDNAVHVGLQLAAEKFGAVKIKGTKAFKEQVLDIAAAKDMNIRFADKNMQREFIERKQTFKVAESMTNATAMNTNETIDSLKGRAIELHDRSNHTQDTLVKESLQEQVKTITQNQLPKLTDQSPFDKTTHPDLHSQFENGVITHLENIANKVKSEQGQQKGQQVTDFGAAPYQDDPKNSDSYFIELNGKKKVWGVGLQDAIGKTQLRVGDFITLNNKGKEAVTVEVDERNDNGDIIGTKTIETHRNAWSIVKHPNLSEHHSNQQAEKENMDANLNEMTEDGQQEKLTESVRTLKSQLLRSSSDTEAQAIVTAAEQRKHGDIEGMNETLKDGLDVELPADWNGKITLANSRMVFDGSVEKAQPVKEGESPEFRGVYAERTNGEKAFLRDCYDKNHAEQLAKQLMTVDALAQSDTQKVEETLKTIKDLESIETQSEDEQAEQYVTTSKSGTPHINNNGGRFKVEYVWNDTDQHIDMTVNGQPPSEVLDSDKIRALKQVDDFAAKFNDQQLKSGQLDMKQAQGATPVNQDYDNEMKPIRDSDTKAAVMN
ncbi:LPD7 domain-containing protein [Thaumasiovibrio subtropicus]|uniref:LPD7 domain-containing protein n=1 Tax=Thaumasiovibrio subtropicus TaxID=1891207 RepID=UPI000B35D5EF|nr:LPD7 domain-containing protein [Thaumasiovibrio subtropicus]